LAVILVVEDDPRNQELVTRFLKREGHIVLHAEDGEAAVVAARAHLPAMVLMDLGLPGMDGLEAARRIRSNPETAHIPILALTASTLSDSVFKAREAGIDAYETKPVAYLRLMRKIEELVKTKRTVL
jgi:two-component system cell cycle response regulator DivK